MTRVISVIGGKGGIGKTTLTSNLAAALSQLGNDVVAVDANLTTPNLGLHLGMHLAPNTLHDVLKGESKLSNATYPHELGFKVIPGSMSIEDLEGVDAGKLPEVTLSLLGKSDFIIYDSAAGLGREALSSISAADEILVITNPDLPSVTDALKTVKIAESLHRRILGVVVNKVRKKGYELTREEVSEMIGYPVLVEIPEDKKVAEAIAAKQPIVAFEPNSPAAVEMKKLAYSLCGKSVEQRIKPRFGILERLVKWMSG
jgi:septum site-determining protein MinD